MTINIHFADDSTDLELKLDSPVFEDNLPSGHHRELSDSYAHQNHRGQKVYELRDVEGYLDSREVPFRTQRVPWARLLRMYGRPTG